MKKTLAIVLALVMVLGVIACVTILPSLILVFDRARMLREKALSLQGYASLFDERADLAEMVCQAVELHYPERWLRKEKG